MLYTFMSFKDFQKFFRKKGEVTDKEMDSICFLLLLCTSSLTSIISGIVKNKGFFSSTLFYADYDSSTMELKNLCKTLGNSKSLHFIFWWETRLLLIFYLSWTCSGKLTNIQDESHTKYSTFWNNDSVEQSQGREMGTWVQI